MPVVGLVGLVCLRCRSSVLNEFLEVWLPEKLSVVDLGSVDVVFSFYIQALGLIFSSHTFFAS